MTESIEAKLDRLDKFADKYALYVKFYCQIKGLAEWAKGARQVDLGVEDLNRYLAELEKELEGK